MGPKWTKSPEEFKRSLEEQRDFGASIGLTDDVLHDYHKDISVGVSREDAFQKAIAGLHLNDVTKAYIRDQLENLPGPEDV